MRALLLLLVLSIPAGWCIASEVYNGSQYNNILTPLLEGHDHQHLLLFGDSVGDQAVPRVDDGFSDPLILNQPFIFFGRRYDQVIVSTCIDLRMS